MTAVRRDALLLALGFALVAVWLVHRPPVWAHGEAREGLVVQDIVRHGHWVLPRRNGALPSKPPLFHWVAASTARIAGLSDATLRVPSALAACVMLLVTFALGVRLGGRLTGWLAVGALAGTEVFWTSASEARTDMLFSCCVVVSLAGFVVWTLDRRRWARVVVYAAATLAVLAKGPAGAVLPGLVIVAFVAAERRPAEVLRLWSWPLATASVLLAVGWYVAAWRSGGDEFVAKQLLQENVHRFVGHGEFAHARWQNPFRMELALFTEVLPWSLVIPWTAVRWWRGRREDTAGRLLHVWWIGILVFFTVAAGKRTVYLLPLYPAVALLAARALAAAPADRLFGRIAVPRVLARLSPARPAVALLLAAIVAFDGTLAVTNQVIREQRERRDGLVPFVHDVAARVPRDAALRASPGVAVPDVYILAYRLARPLARGSSGCDEAGGFLFMPAGAVARRVPGGRALVTSRRKGEQIALVACPSPVAGGALPPS